MKNLFVYYPKCSTCQKAKKWLNDKGILYEEQNIKEQSPTVTQLREWQEKSKLSLKKFFNTSGMLYKSLGLKDKLPGMSDGELLILLATDGMLVKRPILIAGDKVLLGFKDADWAMLE